MIRALFVTLLLAGAAHAHAAIPPKGSDDYEQLLPYASWIEQQATNHGGLCCSLADCRIVPWRVVSNTVQAFISLSDTKGFPKFDGAPDAFVTVPDAVIKRDANPTGQAIACWSKWKADDGGFYCFFLPEMG